MSKARDVARTLARMGPERGTTRLVTELFERQAAQEQHLRELAAQLSLMAELLDLTTTGTVAIRQRLEAVQRAVRQGDDDSLPPTAQ